MVDYYLYVVIGGVFVFNYLDLSLATICGGFYEFALRIKGVPGLTDEVWFAVLGFILWV